MSSLVKICGLTRPSDVVSAISSGANWLGFIVEAKSSRRLSIDDASVLIAGVQAPTIAVSVNPDDALVSQIVDAGFTHIQLHGSETLPRVAEIARSGLITIKAVPVASRDDVKLATEYSGAADWILFDAKPPSDAAQQGGHGTRFDWDVLRGAPLPKRWGLAGGLNPSNVAQAIADVRPALVDVSSGVEVSPGVKDADAMRAFMRAAK